MKILILIILVSCGKPTKKCISMDEAILRCKADAVSRYFPGKVPDHEEIICKQNYPVQGCY